MVVSAIGVRILAVAAVIECGIFVLVVDLWFVSLTFPFLDEFKKVSAPLQRIERTCFVVIHFVVERVILVKRFAIVADCCSLFAKHSVSAVNLRFESRADSYFVLVDQLALAIASDQCYCHCNFAVALDSVC